MHANLFILAFFRLLAIYRTGRARIEACERISKGLEERCGPVVKKASSIGAVERGVLTERAARKTRWLLVTPPAVSETAGC